MKDNMQWDYSIWQTGHLKQNYPIKSQNVNERKGWWQFRK